MSDWREFDAYMKAAGWLERSGGYCKGELWVSSAQAWDLWEAAVEGRRVERIEPESETFARMRDEAANDQAANDE